jgi:hypothetical protein
MKELFAVAAVVALLIGGGVILLAMTMDERPPNGDIYHCWRENVYNGPTDPDLTMQCDEPSLNPNPYSTLIKEGIEYRCVRWGPHADHNKFN